jgi:hypothetical protein
MWLGLQRLAAGHLGQGPETASQQGRKGAAHDGVPCIYLHALGLGEPSRAARRKGGEVSSGYVALARTCTWAATRQRQPSQALQLPAAVAAGPPPTLTRTSCGAAIPG